MGILVQSLIPMIPPPSRRKMFLNSVVALPQLIEIERPISLPLTDMNKIEALKAKTGFDAGKAIQFQKAVDAETDVKTTEVGRQRRVQPSKYDIIK